MDNRRFLRGLSGGVTMIAIAGAFWFGLGLSGLPRDTKWPVWALLTLVQAGGCGALIWAGARMRRRAGSKPAEARQDDATRRTEVRRILVGFFWTTFGQAALIGIAVLWCVHREATEMIWPSIGLIVSIHFLPLARLFHVRVYNATAIAGSLVSLVAFTEWTAPYKMAFLTGGMAAVMWLSAAYLVLHAEKIAASALREKWLG